MQIIYVCQKNKLSVIGLSFVLLTGLNSYITHSALSFERGDYSSSKIEELNYSGFDQQMPPESSYNKAITEFNLKDWAAAKINLDEVIKEDPNSYKAYLLRGIAKRKQKDFQGAIDDYTLAIQIKPDYAEAFLNRAVAKEYLFDSNGAIADYSEAVHIRGDYKLAYFNRGSARLQAQDNQGAIEDFTKVIELEPNNANAYNNRGLAKEALNDYVGSLQDYDQAIKINTNLADAYYNRGVVKARMHKDGKQSYLDAATDAEKANNLYVQLGNIQASNMAEALMNYAKYKIENP